MPALFQLLASNSALDFVNTLDNRFSAGVPNELLMHYADLVAFAAQAQLLEPRLLAGLAKKAGSVGARKALARALALREALSDAFYAIAAGRNPPPESLQRLRREILDAQQHQELTWTRADAGDASIAQAGWRWTTAESHLALPVWAVALSAGALLTSNAVNHVHECGSQTCRWLFLDTSKNHSRRWCDMAICGNRMKARRFQARR